MEIFNLRTAPKNCYCRDMKDLFERRQFSLIMKIIDTVGYNITENKYGYKTIQY